MSRSDSSTTPARAWLGEVDGLRAVAALMVVMCHYPGPEGSADSQLSQALGGLMQVSAPNLAVAFFFTLSSFLLTYLAVLEREQTGTFRIGRFYLRRIARIWPLYFTVLVAGLLLAWPTGSIHDWNSASPRQVNWIRDHWWQYAFFLSNWSLALNHMGGYVDQTITELAILWSIAVEEQFYLLYPLLLLVIAARPRAAAYALAALLVLGTICRLLFGRIALDIPAPGATAGMYYATFSYLDMFAFGAAAGWVTARVRGNGAAAALRRTASNWTGIGVLIAIPALGALWSRELWYPYSTLSALIYTPIAAVLALGIMWPIQNPGSLISRLLRSTIFRVLGLLSYGIYLWHPIVLRLTTSHVRQLPLVTGTQYDLQGVLLFAEYVFGTVLAAGLTYILIERPTLALKDRVIASISSLQHRQRQGAVTAVLIWCVLAILLAEGGIFLASAHAAGKERVVLGSPHKPRAVTVTDTGITRTHPAR